MAFFKKRPKTSEQKAQKAQMGIAVRLIGCGYVIYIVYQLFAMSPEDDSLSPTLKIAIASVFLVLAAILAVFTVREFIRGYKAGSYNVSSYTDDPVPSDESVDSMAEGEFVSSVTEGEADEPSGDGKDD